MNLRVKDHLLGAGLGISVLLIANLLLQAGLRKHRDIEVQPAEESQLQETSKPVSVSRVSFPDDAKKAQFARLELLGTIMGKPSMAFIFNPQTRSSGLYKINDIVEELKIAQILPGKIILEKDGLTEELFLTSRKVKPVKETDSFVAKDESGTMIISKLQMMAQMLKANEIMSKIKIMPLADAEPNKIKGFRIDNVPPGSIIEDAGIKSGDVIYSVQGQRLQSMGDALAMFNRIQSQSRVEVVLLRNDQPVTLKYELH
jgi:type II secretion system protein C